MSNEYSDHAARGRLRALYDWLTGATPPSGDETRAERDTSDDRAVPARLGPYAIVRKLGEGGMGVVYEARDDRLQRTVAVKTMSIAGDESARRRFWREARAAAGVNHPNICQVYDIGEEQGELFIAMELLDGESLAARLKGGALGVPEVVAIGQGMLGALAALHARGIVHRDLKPSNVFVTPHGVKLLDFGLARPFADATAAGIDLTRAGAVVGTPRYMAPEQATGEAIDARTDLFAAGAILFEMLAGRPAFTGKTVIEILHATVYEQPPALAGPPAVTAIDRLIRRALAKRPDERPASADEMARELAAAVGESTPNVTERARPLTRLVVLPFRVLRADPETDFLAFSLPDAITTSLSGNAALVVRSSATAAKFAGETPDLKAIAIEADVDRVVTGTLLRAGDQVRAVAQLVEAPGGTLIASHTVQTALGDLFRLQDDLAREVVKTLSLPLSGGPSTPAPDAPQNATAYECYLRANELARSYGTLVRARELYERCVELDPSFAPAWARLGRCYRVIDKYIEAIPDAGDRAAAALRRALELNPRLSIAHKHLAAFEADTGHAERAIVRLLGEATRHGNDPELFAGLVHACRYAGLYEASIAAHAEARRLDPHVPTSLEQTLLMAGDLDRLLATERVTPGGSDAVIRVTGLGLAGRRDEARAALLALRDTPAIPAFRVWTDYLLAWLDRRTGHLIGDAGDISMLKIMDDPEAIFEEGWMLADVGLTERALKSIGRAVDRGYFASPVLVRARQFDAMRGDARFQSILADAEAGRARALAAFRDAGGDRLLATTSS